MSNNQVIMILESLPNELLFHCFDYLNAFDIFHSFDRLNSRLNKLIRSIQLHISLKNIKKSIFDQFCTKIILNPEIKNQFTSLHLPDRNKCVQSKVFTSLFSLNEFPNLETLQLIPSKKYRQIFTAYDFPTIELVGVSFSKLQTLSLISLNYSFINTNKTFSIVNLTIAQCPLFKLYEFLKSTPMLKYLHIQHMSHGFSNNNYKHLSKTKLICLKQLIIGDYHDSFHDIKLLICRIPNLRSLTIMTYDNAPLINANEWEHLIQSSLPYLDEFKFKLCVFCRDAAMIDVINKFKQFQTDFWQKEHHWYTEYITSKHLAYIYTIPYPSKSFHLCMNDIRYWNKSLVKKFDRFSTVKDLNIVQQISMNDCSYYFSNITSLTITLYEFPTDNVESFEKFVKLTHLKHLDIEYFHSKRNALMLLEIIKQTSQLSSLSIGFEFVENFLDNNELCEYLNRMIRNLKIKNFYRYKFAAKRFCQVFSRIQHLICYIKNENDLLVLLNYFPELSTVEIISDDCYQSLPTFIELEKKLRKENVIYSVQCTPTCNGDGAEYSEMKIFLWFNKQ